MDTFEQPPDDTAIFDDEALAMGPPRARDASWCGRTQGAPVGALSLSALERYQDCPFKFFAADVLRIEELPEDESTLSPRVRGRFIHEVFQRFFQAWDAAGRGVIGSDRLDTARALFEQTAEPLLQRLPDADAALERARLFGSAISVGIVDVVLALEATRPVPVTERWLEHRFEGVFTLGGDREVTLKGVADRVDLLRGNQLRVIDYKSGLAPDPRRALQVPIYALCVAETLAARDGTPWSVDEAAYIALAGRRSFVPVIRSGDHATREALADARERLYAVVDGVVAGEFPPRPHESQLCRHCAYPSVCRKDYVHDE